MESIYMECGINMKNRIHKWNMELLRNLYMEYGFNMELIWNPDMEYGIHAWNMELLQFGI